MFRIFLVLCCMMFSFVFAEPLKANAKYNEATARVEAFKNVEKKIKKDFYRKYLKDPNKKENIEFMKNNIAQTGLGRSLCPFYVKETLALYAVSYDVEPNYNFYYNILGSLIKFDIINQDIYPRKIMGYSRYGNLVSVAFEVDENEQFVYDEHGKLIAHWVDGVLLNKKNKAPKLFKFTRGIEEEN